MVVVKQEASSQACAERLRLALLPHRLDPLEGVECENIRWKLLNPSLLGYQEDSGGGQPMVLGRL